MPNIQAETVELLKGGKFLRLMLENSPEIMLLLDGNGCVAYCTDALLRLAGIADVAEIVGKPFQYVYAMLGDDEFVNAGIARFNEVKAGHKTVANDISIDFSGKGENRKYTVQAAPLLGESGEFDGVLAIYYDTTDLRNAEADIRTHILLDATPLACSFWDADGKMLDCNEEALRMFGVSCKEDYLNHLRDLSPEYQPDGQLSSEKMDFQDAKAMETGYLRTEWLHRSLTGDALPCEVTLVRVPWKDGFALATYSRDLREFKATERRAREADLRNRELEISSRAAIVASEAKSNFLASMSHEIRTPMNAIIGMSNLIPTDNLSAEQLGYLEDIRKMSGALLNIINDILDFSKIEAGKMELLPVHFNLCELYANICSMSRFLAANKGLEFRSSFAQDVPHVIFGDDTRIRQIIVNLINNAIKYTRKGFAELSVSLVNSKGADCIAFKIRDSGIGIRREDFPKLFKSFGQLDLEENRGILGTGLGLSIVRNLSSMMSGEVTVESEYGKGSEFTFLLPLIAGDAEKIEAAVHNPFSVAAENVSVLVADDNSINLKVALAYLARHNIHADTVTGGREAVEAVKSANYDLVFMDHMMPDIDGLEATRQIRLLGGSFETLPIIALSANAVAGARTLFLNAGMNDFLAKPIEPSALNGILLKWLPPEKISTAADETPEPQTLTLSDAVLDRSAGIHRAADDVIVYEQLLDEFKKDHLSDNKKIAESLNSGDRTSAHRTAHTLKSTAAQIGAERLRQISAKLEAELAGSEPYNPGLLTSLTDELSAVRAELRATGVSAVPRIEIAAKPLDKSAALILAERLEPLLEAGNAASLAMLGEIKDVFAALEPLTTRLSEQIQDFNFSEACETLRIMKQQII
ncbi:MAG: response regulator [Oscillospiraceae bacterium]|nr:response regulator [Oscillospiraceae bacterium]